MHLPLRLSPRNSFFLVLGIGIFLLVSGLYYYGYSIPLQETTAHKQTLLQTVAKLKASATTFMKSTWSPVFSDLSASYAQKQADISTAQRSLYAYTQTLNNFQQAGHIPEHAQLSLFTGDYAALQSLDRHAESMTLQSREIISHYRSLETFLSDVTQAEQDYHAIIAEFSTQPNIEVYVDRTVELRESAQRLSLLAEKLQHSSTPEELLPIRTALIQTYQATSTGYAHLANGIDAAIDSLIDDAAHETEAAISQHDTNDATLFSDTMKRSSILHEIESLPDKYDAIE